MEMKSIIQVSPDEELRKGSKGKVGKIKELFEALALKNFDISQHNVSKAGSDDSKDLTDIQFYKLRHSKMEVEHQSTTSKHGPPLESVTNHSCGSTHSVVSTAAELLDQDVVTLTVPETTQKKIHCLIGKDLFVDKTWCMVKKQDLLEDTIRDANSPFTNLIQRILDYKRDEMLIGYEPLASEPNQFMLCITETGRDNALNKLEEMKLTAGYFNSSPAWAHGTPQSKAVASNADAEVQTKRERPTNASTQYALEMEAAAADIIAVTQAAIKSQVLDKFFGAVQWLEDIEASKGASCSGRLVALPAGQFSHLPAAAEVKATLTEPHRQSQPSHWATQDWATLAIQQEKLCKQMKQIGITPNSQLKPPQAMSPLDTPRSNSYGEDNDQLSKAEQSLLQKVVRKGLIEPKYDIEVQRKDPNSPLYSVKSFEALHLKSPLLKGVYEMGFNAPSKIQETALPTLLADPPQNMIAQSQSGTGKTAAFVMAMLSRVDPANKYPQVLCLSPTYELAIQIGDVVMKMAQFCPEINIRFAVRREEVLRGTQLSEHIIIGTPGKILDWALKARFFDLSNIKVFVLDEADVMIATQGHRDQSIRIRKALPKDCQIMFFSATYDEDIMEFAEAIVDNPVTIRLKREEESLENIEQYYIECRNQEDKYAAIANIYGVVTIGQAMIFCHTRRTARWLAEKMSKDGHAVALLSGELNVNQRIMILDNYRAGKNKVLITTNVLARGIDIEQVTLVVNYDLPMDQHGRADCETYLHRIGRTGRFGKNGLAINLIDSQQAHEILRQIKEHFGKEIRRLDSNDVDKLDQLNKV